MSDTLIEDQAITFTRDEAIEYVMGIITNTVVEQGAELAQVIGGEMAARMTLRVLAQNEAAMEALGVTSADLDRVASDIESRQSSR